MDMAIISSYHLLAKKLRALTRGFEDEADNNGDDGDDDDDRQYEDVKDLLLVSLILKEMVQDFDSWSNDWVLEASFILQHITPFMKHIYTRTYNTNSSQRESHVTNKGDSCMGDNFVYHKASTGDIFDLIAVEVKPPTKSSYAQLQSDFVKLGKEMKDIVDLLIDHRVQNPVAGGILVKGYAASTYTLELVSEGVYWMSLLGTFDLLRSLADVSSIPKIIEHFVQLRTLVYPTILGIDAAND